MTGVRDVARRAGVSVSTVSRALTTPDRVSDLTRGKVLAAAADLGYHPNPTAQGLRMGRTHTLGLLVPDLDNPFFASVTKAVQSRARAAGYAVVVSDSDEGVDNEAELISVLARRTDGLVLASPRASDDVLLAATTGVPAVVASRRVPGLPSVIAADGEGAAQALGHLRALGHRRVAVAWGPASSSSGARRLAGLRAAAERYGDVELVDLGQFPPSFTGGFAAADHVVASRASAVVAFNDLMALGILGRLSDRGVRVPDDVSLVGFDDVVLATLVTPALTTVHVPRVRLGHRAVDLLLAQLDDTRTGTEEPELTLPVELTVRASTREPARRPRGAEHDRERVEVSS